MKLALADGLKYEPSDYLLTDFIGPDESDIRCKTTRLVKTRKPHHCLMVEAHPIPAGSIALVERAIVDGEWGAYYLCVACMDSWLDHTRKGAEFPPDNAPWKGRAA